MEFLKTIFGEKALTFAEFVTALKDSKEIKLANLANGDYVGKDKYTALEAERDGFKAQLAEASKVIDDFKSMDIESVKKSAGEWKSKAEKAEIDAQTKINEMKFEFALSRAVAESKAKNTKAVRALLDIDGMKQNGDEIVGLKEQLEKIKAENDYLFGGEETPPPFTKGGMGGDSSGKKMTLDELMKYKNTHPEADITKYI